MLTLVIPVYNEQGTLLRLLDKLNVLRMPHEVIIVDDGSDDGTVATLKQIERERGYTVLFHPENRGKGAAVRTGLEKATGEFLVVQDADLEYDPNDLNTMYEMIVANRDAKVAVFGARVYSGSGPKPQASFYWGNRLLTLQTRILFGGKITDLSTCYKMVRTDWLRAASLNCTKFEFCPEVAAKLLRGGVRVMEVPVSYVPRLEGKKIKWRDGVRAIWTLLRYRVFR